MKKSLPLILIFLFVSTAFAGTEKMDLMLRSYMTAPTIGRAMLSKAVSLKAGVEQISIILKSEDTDLTASYIEEMGGEVSAILVNIMVVTLPDNLLFDLSERDEVKALEAPRPLTPKMSHARVETKVNSVETTYGLTGNNVLVGVIDDALDYGHADFSGRIEYLNVNGTQCSHEGIQNGNCTIATGGSGYTHGTHVTGIAAGANSTYKGVASAAGIAFFSHAGLMTDADPNGTESGSMSTIILNGISKLITIADNMKKPLVINMSLGTSIGAHDGTSLLEQGVDSAVSGKQGRIIVNAAGNETVNPNMFQTGANLIGGIHAGINLTSSQSKGWRMKVINSADISDYALSGGTAVLADVWIAQGEKDNCTIEAKAYSDSDPTSTAYSTSDALFATSSVAFSADTTSDVTATNGTGKVLITVDSSDSQNLKPHAQIFFGPATGVSWSQIANSIGSGGYALDIIVRATSGTCTGNIWLYPDQVLLVDFYKNIDTLSVSGTGGYDFGNGDSNKVITIPGTSNNVITAGSYMQPTTTWTADDGVTYDQTADPLSAGGSPTGGTAGDISLFSSLGPTADGRTKPDVSAPGEPIISTLATRAKSSTSLALTVDSGTHFKMEGTSMSSPHVAGIIALMLERNNCLTYSEAKSALTSTASKSSSSDYTWGYGKVDALSAVAAISSNTSCFTGTGDSTDSELPDASTSTSSCDLVSNDDTPSTAGFMMILSGILLVIMRRKQKCHGLLRPLRQAQGPRNDIVTSDDKKTKRIDKL